MEQYITFRSITTAQRASALLMRNGIRHKLMRTPKSMAGNGCGYSLKLDGYWASAAAELFLREGIGYQRIYEPGDPPTEVRV